MQIFRTIESVVRKSMETKANYWKLRQTTTTLLLRIKKYKFNLCIKLHMQLNKEVLLINYRWPLEFWLWAVEKDEEKEHFPWLRIIFRREYENMNSNENSNCFRTAINENRWSLNILEEHNQNACNKTILLTQMLQDLLGIVYPSIWETHRWKLN